MSRLPFLVFLLAGPSVLAAQPAWDALALERVTSGLSQPIFLTAPPGDTERLFVVEQGSGTSARVRIVDRESGEIASDPFLTLEGVLTGGEQGLLGLAFHPGFADNGYFFVYYTASDAGVNPVAPHRASLLVRYRRAAGERGRADPASATRVLSVPQPFANHNGGWLAFGPDGYLYLATGDGGGSNDPRRAAQALLDDPATEDGNEALLGKLLRLDVDGDDFAEDPTRTYAIPPTNPWVGADVGAPEIWAYGLRNPWRNAFDRATGDLWIADVGQNSWEEINFQPAASSGGENYGWPAREGAHDNPAVPDPAPSPRVEPVAEYDHGEGFSITGGYVYRGAAMPWLQGRYFYADFIAAFVRSFRLVEGVVTSPRDHTATLAASLPAGQDLGAIASFGEDGLGELYLLDRGGEVFRLTQAPYNLWRSRHFPGERLAAGEGTDPGDDPDGDGFSNLVEFLSGGDPLLPDGPWGPFAEVVEEAGAVQLQLAWELDPAATSAVTLHLETATEPFGGEWTPAAFEEVESSAVRRVARLPLDPGENGREWWRWRAELVD
ncbi:MAG: PQQ-dependent sugar dehydrogenase [Opitutales bacterium]